MTSLLDAALGYARAGWPIVPLECGAKKPHVITGRNHAVAATCDIDQITAWWTRWADAGIGVVCAAGGFVVIDVDGEEGRESLNAHPGPFPLTTCATSGRSGYGSHLYYRVPPGQEVPRSRLLAPGLELKAAGNLVVAPPSLHNSGHTYAWDVPPGFMAGGRYAVDPQPPAAWMLEDPRAQRRQARPAPSAAPLNGATATPYGAAAMRAELERLAGAQPGQRNQTLFTVAVRLAELADQGHLDGPEARRRVEACAESLYGGHDAQEREATVDSAFDRIGVAA